TSKRRTPWIFQQRLGNTLKLSSGSLLEKSGDIPPPGGDFFIRTPQAEVISALNALKTILTS
ncbi:hypothetical protein MLI38_027815, partial [Escherichia coli]|nr:hypothetical protein [Escherichia coli]